LQHHLFGGAVLRELCKRWSTDRGGCLTVKQIVQKIEELIERHDKMLKYEYNLGASEALDELRDWIIKMKGGEV
jgi:sugar-specific transcriptional regulator TrmB